MRKNEIHLHDPTMSSWVVRRRIGIAFFAFFWETQNVVFQSHVSRNPASAHPDFSEVVSMCHMVRKRKWIRKNAP